MWGLTSRRVVFPMRGTRRAKIILTVLYTKNAILSSCFCYFAVDFFALLVLGNCIKQDFLQHVHQILCLIFGEIDCFFMHTK